MSSTTQTPDKAAGEPSLVSTMENGTSTSNQPVSILSRAPPPQRPNLLSSSSSNSSLTTSSSSSSISTPTTPATPISTMITPHPKYNCHKPQYCPKTGHKIDVLQRKFPEPEDKFSVEEALARGPLPGRYAREWVAREETVEERTSEFERAKRELRSWRSG